ncbi:MAG: hypothetical protein WCI64_10845, partial [Chlorobium sp.]
CLMRRFRPLFNAPGGGHLSLENLKGATGELALRLGAENEPPMEHGKATDAATQYPLSRRGQRSLSCQNVKP